MQRAPEEPDLYVVSHVREALAEDDRVTQLDLDVSVAGRTLYVSGEVPSDGARQAVAEIVRTCAPGYTVCNETRVASLSEPNDAEQIG